MPRRWLAYALALLGALALRVFYTGWLAGALLGWVALLPLLGLLVSLPCALSARASLRPHQDRLPRGETVRWHVLLTRPLGLPLGRVKLTAVVDNRFLGVRQALPLTLTAGEEAELPQTAPDCGLLSARLTRAWALDCLGLFWLPLRRGPETQVWVGPIPTPPDALTLPQAERPGLRPKPGGGPGEDYDPRPYRPGDPLNSIHWKLSAKRDELVTRETLETVLPAPLLTFDCFGTPQRLNDTLDRLAGTSAALRAQNRPHLVAWAHPVTGEVHRFPVSSDADWARCLEAILSQTAPQTGRSILDAAGLGASLHLSKGGEVG